MVVSRIETRPRGLVFFFRFFQKGGIFLAKRNKLKMLEAIEFMMSKPTYTKQEVAEILGISDRQLRNWENDLEDKSGWNAMKDKMVSQVFKQVAPMVVGVLVDLSKNAKSEMVRMQSAQDLLDRAGYGPVDKSEVQISGTVTFVDDVPMEDDDE